MGFAMTFEELGDSIRDALRGNPSVTVIERADTLWSRHVEGPIAYTVKCGECGKVIRQGGTLERFELCRDCNPGEE
jgi:hypothetical protein